MSSSHTPTANVLATPMTHNASRTRLATDLLVLAISLLGFLFLAYKMAPFMPDDSFISFRYAEHLAAGDGLRFNLGQEPVEGYSNFLWVLVLAAVSRTGGDLTQSSAVIGALLGSLSLVVLWWILRRRGHSGWNLAIPVGLLALSGPVVLYAISGMETALYMVLLLAVILSLDFMLTTPAAFWAVLLAVVASLVALSRPEGVIAFPVLAAGVLALEWLAPSKQKRQITRALLLAALVFVTLMVVYHLVRVAYFEAWLPTPFLSKGAARFALFDAWTTNLRQFFVRQTHYYTPMAYYYLAIGVPAVIGGLLSLPKLSERKIELLALLLALIYAAVYVNFVDWMPGMRYYAPLVGLMLIPFSILGFELARPDSSPYSVRTNLSYILLGLVLAFISLSSVASLRMEGQRLQASTQESLVELGQWLRETLPASTLVAISDVGAAPYYSQLSTFDFNPDSLTDRHIATEGWSSEYFFEVDPDVVVFTAFSQTEPDFNRQHEELHSLLQFQSAYELAGITRNDWYRDRSYWVFVRQSLDLTTEQLSTFPRGLSR